MAYIKVEAENVQQMVLGVAKAYGYYEPESPPMWWDTFWQWYLAYAALTRENRLVGAFVDTSPWQAMSWFISRALMENDYNDDAALVDMLAVEWFREALEEFKHQRSNSPDNRNEVAVVIIQRDFTEVNPWKQMACEAMDTVKVDLGKREHKDGRDTPIKDARPSTYPDHAGIDYHAERQRMVEAEKPSEPIKFPHTGMVINDPHMTPAHRMALAQPGDKVDLREPMPPRCLMGAPGSALDDDKEFEKDAWCAAHGPNTPSRPEGTITGRTPRQDDPPLHNVSPPAPSRQFGAVPAPTRPAQHQSIDTPDDDRPVEARLADAQPGDRISIAEPLPEKCLFGAKSTMIDDDVVHADVAFCHERSTSAGYDDGDDDFEPEDDDNYDDTEDAGYDDGGGWEPNSDDENSLQDPEQLSASNGDLSEPRLDQRGTELADQITPPEVVDASAEPDRSVESVIPTDTLNANNDVLAAPSTEEPAQVWQDEPVQAAFDQPADEAKPEVNDSEETKTDLPAVSEDGFKVDYDEHDERPD